MTEPKVGECWYVKLPTTDPGAARHLDTITVRSFTEKTVLLDFTDPVESLRYKREEVEWVEQVSSHEFDSRFIKSAFRKKR